MGVEVGVFEGAQGGEVEGETEFPVVEGVGEQAPGDLLDGLEKGVGVGLQEVQVGGRGGDAVGDDVEDEVHIEVGEVEERGAFTGLGKVYQPEDAARADQDVFEVEVAVDDGAGAVDDFGEGGVEVGEGVGEGVIG